MTIADTYKTCPFCDSRESERKTAGRRKIEAVVGGTMAFAMLIAPVLPQPLVLLAVVFALEALIGIVVTLGFAMKALRAVSSRLHAVGSRLLALGAVRGLR